MSPLPFSGLDRRTAWVRGTLLLAMLLGMLASRPVWFNARLYPLSPVAGWFPILSAPWDLLLYAAMLLALVLAGWCYRPAMIFFLCAGVFQFCQDQNRGQPWFYLYAVMLLLNLFPPPASWAASRWAMTAVYFWSGVQKINSRYFQTMPEWFTAPAADWQLPGVLIAVLRGLVALAPFVEIAIGLALWLPRGRVMALIVAALLHLLAVLFLGPLGHDYNWVVWPWNLAMIALLVALFLEKQYWRGGAAGRIEVECKTGRGLTASLIALRRSRAALVLTALFCVLPVLSFFGKWDSDFSFALYSENQAAANIFVNQTFAERLPKSLRQYVHPLQAEYDPLRQGPYTFRFPVWCYDTLHVPPYPEPRSYAAVYEFLRRYAEKPEEVRMIVGTRGGPVLFYEGGQVERLTPAR